MDEPICGARANEKTAIYPQYFHTQQAFHIYEDYTSFSCKNRFNCNMECGSRHFNITRYSWRLTSWIFIDELRFRNTNKENWVKNLIRVISNKAVNKYCWMVFEQTYVKWYGGLRKCSTIFSPCDYFFFVRALY